MVGQRIEGKAGARWIALFFFALAVMAVSSAAVNNIPELAVLAVLPWAIGFALWLTRDRRLTAEVTKDGLEVLEPPIVLAYDDIRGVEALGPTTARRFPMCVHHAGGRLFVPACLNVPSRELFDFLRACMPPVTRPLPPALEDYRRKQEERWGSESVTCYRGGTRFPRTPRWPRGTAVSLAFMLSGLIWIGYYAIMRPPDKVFLGLGIPLAVLGGLFALGFRLDRGGGGLTGDPEKNALVLGPRGLALVQGKVSGELGWDEVKEIKYPFRPGAFSNTPFGGLVGIGLVVAGATIIVANVYDRPLAEIYEQMCRLREQDPEQLG